MSEHSSDERSLLASRRWPLVNWVILAAGTALCIVATLLS
jgi:hypothetical protein